VLANAADLLEDLDVSENETIFEKGDMGDSMYVILDHKVRVLTSRLRDRVRDSGQLNERIKELENRKNK